MRPDRIRFELILKSARAGRPEVDPDRVVAPGDAAVDVTSAGDGIVDALRRDHRHVLHRIEAHVEEFSVAGHVYVRRLFGGSRVTDIPRQRGIRGGRPTPCGSEGASGGGEAAAERQASRIRRAGVRSRKRRSLQIVVRETFERRSVDGRARHHVRISALERNSRRGRSPRVDRCSSTFRFGSIARPTNDARLRSAREKLTPTNSSPSKSTPDACASCISDPTRRAPASRTPASFAPRKLAPVSCASRKSAPRRSAPCRSQPTSRHRVNRAAEIVVCKIGARITDAAQIGVLQARDSRDRIPRSWTDNFR